MEQRLGLRWSHRKRRLTLPNIFFCHDDAELDYLSFMEKDAPVVIIALAAFIATSINIIALFELGGFNIPPAYTPFLFARFLNVLALYVYAYCMITKKYFSGWSLPFHSSYAADILLISFAVCDGLFLFGLTIPVGCDSSIRYNLACGNGLPNEFVMYMFITTLLPMLTKCHHTGTPFIAVIIETFFMIVLCIRKDKSVIPVILTVFVIQVVYLFDMTTTFGRMYESYCELGRTLISRLDVESTNELMVSQTNELRSLIGNVAHDLKTPLQALSYELGTAKGLLVSTKHTDNDVNAVSEAAVASIGGNGMKNSLDILSGVCAYMSMIINRAIDYHKVSSNIELQPALVPMNLSEALHETLQCAEKAMGGSSASIEIAQIPEEVCGFIITDKQWFLDNVLCFLSNACQFSALDGSICVRCSLEGEANSSNSNTLLFPAEVSFDDDLAIDVEIADSPGSNGQDVLPLSSRPAFLLVEVIDSGSGVPDEKKESVFRMGLQGSRQSGGMGLGLFTLRKRVERLGGSCGATDRPDGGRGSRFWFKIPYYPDRSQAHVISCSCSTLADNPLKPPELVAPVVDDVASASLPERIMLVDDSLLIQKTSARAFRNEGRSVVLARDGQECLDKATVGDYQLILMDVQMPVMDGIEATKQLRKWEESCGERKDIESGERGRLIIIGLSANSDSQTKQEGLDAGMDDFLTKPLKMAALRSCLRRLRAK